MRKPDFFIVGAPKCGTTALTKYLSEHPDIYMPKKKEIHYFATDLPNYRRCLTEEDYLKNYFSQAHNNHKSLGEASVYYLYSKEAIKNIYDFNKNAKLIISLRNPVEMVYSLHSQFIWSAGEDELDFNTAWSKTKLRKEGKALPKYYPDEKVLFYDEIAKYSEQLERVYNIFPKENVKVILFDDFKLQTKSVYKEVLDFLNVADDHRNQFEKVNVNTLPISIMFNKLLVDQPRFIINVKNFIKSIIGQEDLKIGNLLKKYNTKKVIRKPLDEKIKNEIIKNYEYDIKKLSSIIARDLSHWIS